MYTISQLFIYPVKSLGGIEVAAAQLTDRGLQYDRRWMVVDLNNQFLTQREHPDMCLLQTAIAGGDLVIFDKNNPTDKITVALHPEVSGETVQVQVWDDSCAAQPVSHFANEWFSQKLKMPCRLVYMPEEEKRLVDERYAHSKEITSFSDGYPLLMIGQASLNDLNGRLHQPLPMERFRPNIVFTGGEPYAEDTMKNISINEIDLFGVKLCARCVMPTINQQTAEKGKEPLKTLSVYRMKNNKIYFGQNMLYKQTGYLQTGNTISIIETTTGFTSA